MNKINKLSERQKELLEMVQGEEITFKDEGCVFIKNNTLISCGKVVFEINSKTFNEFMDQYNLSEFGTIDADEIAKRSI